MKDTIEKKTLPVSERCLCFLVTILVCHGTYTGTTSSLIRMIVTLPPHFEGLLVKGIIVVIGLGAVSKLFVRPPLLYFFISLLLTTGVLFSWTLEPDYGDYFITILGEILIQCTVFYWICSSVRADAKTFTYLSNAAFLITLGEIIQLLVSSQGLDGKSYSQYMGYRLLPAAIISLVQIFDSNAKHRLLHAANIAVASLLLLSAGARGPLVCVAILGVFLIAISKNTRLLKIAVVMLGVAFVAAYSSGELFLRLEDIKNWLLDHNLSVRVIDKFLSGDFLKDNARTLLVTYSWQEILSHPIFGVGLGRDRILLAQAILAPPSTAIGWYPHNLIFELLLHYGLILGSMLVIGIVILVVKSCCLNKEPNTRKLAQVFFGIGVLPLFFSGSYLTSPLFFSWLAFSLRACAPHSIPLAKQMFFLRYRSRHKSAV